MASRDHRHNVQRLQPRCGVSWPSPKELGNLRSTRINPEEAMNKKPTFKERMCSRDTHKFRKYIENTTTHGVVRIFTGKSKVRRLFWAIVVVFAAGFCLYNIIDQMVLYASNPTVKTFTQKLVNQGGPTFPSVTICNLNPFKKSIYESIVDKDTLSALNDLLVYPSTACSNETLLYNVNQSNHYSYRHIQDAARHQAQDLVVSCTFAGKECNYTNFNTVLTRLGYCYTFNGNKPALKSQGVGIRYGLSLTLNVEQYDYLDSPVRLDAGVQVVIHSQDEPPVPDDIGIAIAPGRNMFLGIRQRNVADTSTIGRRGKCRKLSDTTSFNFLRGRFQYSSSACRVDCFFTNVTEECGCIDARVESPPLSSRYQGFADCSPTDVYCCVNDHYKRAQPCDCPVACEYTTYDITTSYSAFPSTQVAGKLSQTYNKTVQDITNNYLALNVYYESQDTEFEETMNAYKFSALLSDIGGLLGLFLGMSVISMLEFGTWVLDEIKDRCFGVNDKKLGEWYDAAEAELEVLEMDINRNKQRSQATSTLVKASLKALDTNTIKDSPTQVSPERTTSV